MRRVLMGILLLALLAPVAGAQATGTLTLSVSPDQASVRAGQSAAVNLSVTTSGLVPEQVQVQWTTTDARVQGTTAFTVLPTAGGSTVLSIGAWANASAGDRVLSIWVQDTTTGAVSNTARFVLHVATNATGNATNNATTNATQNATGSSSGSGLNSTPKTTPSPGPTNATSSSGGDASGPGPVPASDQAPPTPGSSSDAPATREAETGPAPARDPPPGPLPPRTPRALAVDPTLLIVPPQGWAELRVVETDLAPVSLHLPPDFEATLVSEEGAVWTFHVSARPGAPQYLLFAATAQAGQTAAPFGLRVENGTRLDAAAVTLQRPPDAPSPWPYALLAAAAGAAAFGLARAHRRWPYGLAILYSRISPSRLLAHPQRRRMRDAVAASPGLGVNELQRAMGLAKGVFDHHLHRLLTAGHLRAVEDGQRRRLYVPGAVPEGGQLPLGERVIRFLAERGETPTTRLAAELGVSRQALHYHVKRLAREGLVTARRDGNEVLLAPKGFAP
ncbi:MAG: hypothetical protein QOE90_3085 [Thermoplasmata archaeon]|jgi:DNA-binding transcriptional ArsR family regulator|nr:hypothetical protein [Thermoplasmata archaeon]